MADNAVPGPSKAIGSLTKRSVDATTRQGNQKTKFIPVLPTRRAKDQVKAEPTNETVPPETTRGRGRGRGRGEGRGRGRGGPRAPIEMTASGPFAMGPAMAGNNARRSVPRSNFTIPTPTADRSSLGAGLTRVSAAVMKKENELKGEKIKASEEDEEVYSDPDEGVEIVDMENVRQMDWMAPESLRKERHAKKKVKKEEPTDPEIEAVVVEVDAANALDLSESEEEEEFEDLVEHFSRQENVDEDPSLREERLYFFQFPNPFPEFLPYTPPVTEETSVKKVTFAEDAKPGSLPGSARGSVAPSEATVDDKAKEPKTIDGIIGSLEVYRSGAVKMRLSNGILLEVTAATQPSFLQHAVCLDIPEHRLTVLGEVNKRFVVSPQISSLLMAMELSDRSKEGTQMDVT